MQRQSHTWYQNMWQEKAVIPPEGIYEVRIILIKISMSF